MKELDEARRGERSRLRAELMEALQKGDPDGCAALFDDIGPSLTYFLRRRVADAHELQDVYQEVFMALFEAVTPTNRDGRLSPGYSRSRAISPSTIPAAGGPEPAGKNWSRNRLSSWRRR
jgi:hypothetical protein